MENLKNLSDKDLLVDFQKGSERAFEEIHNRYFDRLFLHALKMLRDEEAAQDVVQEVFIAFWSKSRQLNIQKSLSAYLYTATRNRVLNVIEQGHVYNHHISAFTAFLEQTSIEDAANHYEDEALFRLFESEVNNLPPKMREVFEMRLHEEMSYNDIAEKLSISDKTVKKQINNAIKILKMRIVHWRSNLAFFSFVFFF